MVFMCQRNSFLKEYSTKVISCDKKDLNNGEEPVYEIICEDTVLFPEGGGQPCDFGMINDIPIHQVLRRGDQAVHLAKNPIPPGTEVRQIIDWPRRLDHMQQHSGQHLITAVINEEFKIATTSWWLGVDVSHIELDTKDLTLEQISLIERIVNEKIDAHISVEVKMYMPGDPELDSARTRGLPEDVAGPIRVVSIVGIEDDLCCGTHVSNLSQLRVIKLLYAEKGKKNKTNLFFLAGNRVTKHMDKMLEREAKFTKLLCSTPEDHPELVAKLQNNLKLANKKLVTAMKQLAAFEAKQFLSISPRPKYFLHHKDAETDYLDAFLRALKVEKVDDVLFVLSAGESAGTLYVIGDDKLVSELGPQCAEILEGKGLLHGRKFQAKVGKLQKIKKVHEFIENYYKEKFKL